jgi:ABC-type transport system involved in Fe-S cluster assembly fused permease/ATPase subunit
MRRQPSQAAVGQFLLVRPEVNFFQERTLPLDSQSAKHIQSATSGPSMKSGQAR